MLDGFRGTKNLVGAQELIRDKNEKIANSLLLNFT